MTDQSRWLDRAPAEAGGPFVGGREDVPLRGILLLFVAFIRACDTTHLIEAAILWWPAYQLAGVVKLFTAMVSWATVLALVPVVPMALAMRSPEELEWEILARRQAETALQRANAELERWAEAALRAKEERLLLALEAAHMETWDWDIRPLRGLTDTEPVPQAGTDAARPAGPES